MQKTVFGRQAQSGMDTLALMVALLLFLVSSTVITIISKLLHLRLRVPEFSVAHPERIPDNIKASMIYFADHRLPEGFSLSHFENNTTSEIAIKQREWVAVYYHEVEASYVEISVHPDPTPERPFRLVFNTLFDEARIVTVDSTDTVLDGDAGRTQDHKSTQAGPHGQFRQHLFQVLSFENKTPNTPERISLNIVDYVKRANEDAKDFFENVQRKNRSANPSTIPGIGPAKNTTICCQVGAPSFSPVTNAPSGMNNINFR